MEIPNVMIFGTDSVSRMNLDRHMPKTSAFLKSVDGFYDFVGFNKVGRNTDPNLFAILTGFHGMLVYSNSPCRYSNDDNFDECPMIWKDFHEAGYVTMFSEDVPALGFLNFDRSVVAFSKKPTDYYSRPATLATEDTISFGKGKDFGVVKNCYGGTPAIKVNHDMALNLLQTFKDVPVFGLYWSSASTHEELEEVSRVDEYQEAFLKSFMNSGLNNNTVLIFMSDHGNRLGNITRTFIGGIEKNRPYFYIYLPKWLREKYSLINDAMKMNTKRLATNADVYQTLRHILTRKFDKDYSVDDETHRIANSMVAEMDKVRTVSGSQNVVNKLKFNSNPLGQTLFKEISPLRTCADVLIQDSFCTCQSSLTVEVDSEMAVQSGKQAVIAINNIIQDWPLCQKWQLEQVRIYKYLFLFKCIGENFLD